MLLKLVLTLQEKLMRIVTVNVQCQHDRKDVLVATCALKCTWQHATIAVSPISSRLAGFMTSMCFVSIVSVVYAGVILVMFFSSSPTASFAKFSENLV